MSMFAVVAVSAAGTLAITAVAAGIAFSRFLEEFDRSMGMGSDIINALKIGSINLD
jgi:hypothetical protein